MHIRSFPIQWFYIFFLIHYTKNIQIKRGIRLPNNLYKFYNFFHLKVHPLVYSIYPFQFLVCKPKLLTPDNDTQTFSILIRLKYGWNLNIAYIPSSTGWIINISVPILYKHINNSLFHQTYKNLYISYTLIYKPIDCKRVSTLLAHDIWVGLSATFLYNKEYIFFTYLVFSNCTIFNQYLVTLRALLDFRLVPL